MSRGLFDLGAGEPGGVEDDVPVELAQCLGPVVEAGRVLLDEPEVEHSSRPAGCCRSLLTLEQQRADRLEQCEVAVHLDREVQVGKSGPDTRQPARGLWVVEPLQACLLERVDGEDLGSVLLRLLQCRQHARVVGARVLTTDHDQLGVVDVLQRHTPLADADHLGQRHRRRLVTHVGAVGQVVGAEGAREQLVEEGGLVRRLAGGVEDRLVRAVEVVQVRGDQREGLVPGDRLVVGSTGAAYDGMGDPALLPQPVVGALGQVREAVSREELRTHASTGGFLGHGLGAVLAELRGVAVIRIGVRPGTALTVEPVDLVELEQAARGTGQTHGLDPALHRDGDGREARCRPLRALDVQARLVDVVLWCLPGHAGLVASTSTGLMSGSAASRSGPT